MPKDKSLQEKPSCFMLTDGWTTRRDEANEIAYNLQVHKHY
jgi:hypothetical protein